MSVHKKKDGRWFVKYRDRETNRLKWEYFGRGLEGERQAIARNDELGLGSVARTAARRESPSFHELARAYLDARRGIMQKSTEVMLWYKLKAVILPEIGNLPALRVTHYRMDQYVAKRLRKVKKTTVHREISDIHAILNWAVRRRHIQTNPLAGYEKPKRDDEIIRPVTRDEARRLLNKAPAHLVRALALSYYTGLRPGNAELFGLRWSDVDRCANTILVRSAKKNGPPFRVIPIHSDFIPILNKWYVQDGGGDEEKAEINGPIITYRGKAVKSIKKSFETAKRKAGITRRLPPYAFRHAFATFILGKGGDLKSASEILGHSRPDTTVKVYQHTNPNLLRKTVNKLPTLPLPEDK